MPRNEFKAGDEEEWEDTDAIFEINGVPHMLVFKVSPGKESSEASDQEVAPVEDDPHMWPPETAPTLAELRKSHRSVTEAHIAGPATSD